MAPHARDTVRSRETGSRVGISALALLLACAVFGPRLSTVAARNANAAPKSTSSGDTAPSSGLMYVVDSETSGPQGRILVLDPSQGAVKAAISTGMGPDIALSPDGTKLYVSSSGPPAETLSTYDTASLRLISQVPNPDIIRYKFGKYLSSVAGGSDTDYSVSCYGSSDFEMSPCPDMDGGSDGNTTYATGSVSITVGGFRATATYGAGSTSVSIAAALANSLNASNSPVTAVANAAVISTTSKVNGDLTNYTIPTSYTFNAGEIGSPPFQADASGMQLTRGTD